MWSIMAGAKSGMPVASGAFCASAICDGSAAKKAKTTPRRNPFEVLMTFAMAEVLRPERMMIVSAVGMLNKNSTSGCGRYTGLVGTTPPPNKVGLERDGYGFRRIDQTEDAHATRAANVFQRKI